MQKKIVVMLAAAMMMAVPTLGLAALAGSNTVNSAAIIDGAVVTVDIANKAVTAAKIADATITATQLSNGAVTAAKLGIVCSTGQILQYTATGWVCSTGTPGPQGIQGPVGAAGPQGLASKYANVIVVAKSGGDFIDPVSAMNSITTASVSNPYLLKIMPGVYDIGTLRVIMQPYVDIEGSGEKVTTIRGLSTGSGVIHGSNYAEIRHLTVEGQGNGNFTTVGVDNLTQFDFSIANSTITATGAINNIAIQSSGNISLTKATVISIGGSNAYGLYIENAGSVATVNDSTIQSSNANTSVGIMNSWGDPSVIVNNSTIVAKGIEYGLGLYYFNSAGPATIKGSTVSASGPSGAAGIQSSGSVKVAYSQFDAPFSTTGAKCIGVYDANFTPVTCP